MSYSPLLPPVISIPPITFQMKVLISYVVCQSSCSNIIYPITSITLVPLSFPSIPDPAPPSPPSHNLHKLLSIHPLIFHLSVLILSTVCKFSSNSINPITSTSLIPLSSPSLPARPFRGAWQGTRALHFFQLLKNTL